LTAIATMAKVSSRVIFQWIRDFVDLYLNKKNPTTAPTIVNGTKMFTGAARRNMKVWALCQLGKLLCRRLWLIGYWTCLSLCGEP